MAFDLKRKKLVPSAKYSFVDISPDPKKPIALVTLHLGMTNPDYYNAEMKRRKDAEDDKGSDFERLQMVRRRDIDALANHCVTGWENVADGGQDVPFSKEGVLTLLNDIAAAYPEEIDAYRLWAKVLDSFRIDEDLGKG